MSCFERRVRLDAHAGAPVALVLLTQPLIISSALQRRLLERLVALAASVIGSQVPLAAVTLETLGLLLEVLGEVSPETAQLLESPLLQKLTCQHSLLRMQVNIAQLVTFNSGLDSMSLMSKEVVWPISLLWCLSTRYACISFCTAEPT